jgi:hypothetical protein
MFYRDECARYIPANWNANPEVHIDNGECLGARLRDLTNRSGVVADSLADAFYRGGQNPNRVEVHAHLRMIAAAISR